MRSKLVVGLGVVAIWGGAGGAQAGEDWPQWGGAGRNFRVADARIETWDKGAGPRTLWKRELGEGYSAIVSSGDTLYTMYREGDEEVVAALDAAGGETRWTHRYPAPLGEKANTNFGKGPNATPLIAGERLVTVGFNGQVFCLNRSDGKVLWSLDILKDLNGTFADFGYSSSPLQYEDLVILPVGAAGKSVVALGLEDGREKWASADFQNSYSSPVIVDVAGRKQIVLVMTKEVIGLDAATGRLAWSHPYKNQWDTHCGTVVDCGAGVVFAPSFGGGVALKLTQNGAETAVEELWTTKKIGAGHMNVVLAGEHLFGAAGSERAGLYSAVRVKDGEEAWRERLPIAQTVLADQRLVLLDETGSLRLAAASAEKLDVQAEAQVLEAKSWTVPTLVGSRLYLRDQKHIVALELGH